MKLILQSMLTLIVSYAVVSLGGLSRKQSVQDYLAWAVLVAQMAVWCGLLLSRK